MAPTAKPNCASKNLGWLPTLMVEMILRRSPAASSSAASTCQRERKLINCLRDLNDSEGGKTGRTSRSCQTAGETDRELDSRRSESETVEQRGGEDIISRCLALSQIHGPGETEIEIEPEKAQYHKSAFSPKRAHPDTVLTDSGVRHCPRQALRTSIKR